MNENQKFNNLYILVSAFIHELGGPFTLTKDEFYEIKAMIRMGKVEAIKHLRHITRINEETLFNLDLTTDCHTTYHSTLTRWAVTNDVDLRTGEVTERALGLKKAKDIVEFIELNS
jgi:hypothetical protein